ncbi:hypothetical protein BOTCAL_0970g00010 [Botryotinia calthae]|uniref:Uncharacterized protein n=1 Tax=Botryotinia calthae TaxID=38488 RepID=A0A4Y8CEH1_9HELO|nr:hypothetical protein BOTCAL_0970g00010 [Botryotinia calthae]
MKAICNVVKEGRADPMVNPIINTTTNENITVILNPKLLDFEKEESKLGDCLDAIKKGNFYAGLLLQKLSKDRAMDKVNSKDEVSIAIHSIIASAIRQFEKK